MTRPGIAIATLAVLGLIAAAGIGLLVNAVSGDSIGLAAEPLSAAPLAPPEAAEDAADRREERRERARDRREERRERAQDRAEEQATTIGDDDFESEGLDDNSGTGSSNSGSGSDDSGSDDSSGSGSGEVEFDDD